MLFSSITFLFYFLPPVLLLYFAVPFRAKNLVLLLASLLFYFYGEPIYTLLLFGSALSAYIHGLLIARFRATKLSRVFLVSSIAVSLMILGFFKYADFAIETVNGILGTGIGLLNIALPIGISFYTFQTLSYTIDVYRKKAQVQKSFLKLFTYVALFPQLIAGPIVRYTTIENELSLRKHSLADAAYGAGRFVLGLGKKVLLANAFGLFCTEFRASAAPSVLYYWLYAIAFCLQVYFDFSGYSDMAIGLGRIFGFKFLENFDYPFISTSVSEFWRRWHISLGAWFRDYLYIPLGGNRVSLPRWLFNILVVWFLTGLWHGASWNFVVWGLFFAVFLAMEKLFLGRVLQKLPKFVSHMYLLIVVVISFVIFNAGSIAEIGTDLSSMFGLAGLPFSTFETRYALSSYAVLFVVAILGCTPLVSRLYKRIQNNKLGFCARAVSPLVLAALLILITAYLVDGGFNPFLYFRF
ncbi:MAG: MBOAT family O-acyltransferase [Clostridia bacterium]|nr:MBOAT family O-acyltransferase [Clostridia bacterium]